MRKLYHRFIFNQVADILERELIRLRCMTLKLSQNNTTERFWEQEEYKKLDQEIREIEKAFIAIDKVLNK